MHATAQAELGREGGPYIVQKCHGVTRVDRKHQGQKGEEAGLKSCHRVLQVSLLSTCQHHNAAAGIRHGKLATAYLEVQVKHMGGKVEQVRVGEPR